MINAKRPAILLSAMTMRQVEWYSVRDTNGTLIELRNEQCGLVLLILLLSMRGEKGRHRLECGESELAVSRRSKCGVAEGHDVASTSLSEIKSCS